jgi:hypothetical protein
MVKERRPTFVFLMETISSKQYMEDICKKIGFDRVFVVDPIGRSGGLAFLWNSESTVEVYNYSRRHINIVVKDGDNNPWWKLTGFYGNPVCARRADSWELLKFLSTCHPVPWLCAGDFNEVVTQEEKEGSNLRKESQMTGFREALEVCRLGDLGFSGSPFTWSNRRSDGTFTKERLDRAVANLEWCSLFPSSAVDVLAARTSDHSPVLVSFSSYPRRSQSRGPTGSGFKLEASWLNDAESGEIIRSAWHSSPSLDPPSVGIQQRLAACRRALLDWGGHKFGKEEETVKEKTAQLAALQSNECPAVVTQIKALQREIDDLMEFEDMKWKQRAKQHWLRYGDRNTAFYHSWVQHRRKINRIRSVTDEQGRTWTKIKDIGKVFNKFYEELFTSQGTNRVEECISGMDTRVTEDMNRRLLHGFSEEEIKIALFQMHPLKAPGPDGFPAAFYQRNWPTVGSEVCKAVLAFLNDGQMDMGINATNIVLIPKVNSPSKPFEYRPISLCNVIYKLISKVLANRLKPILSHIVSPEQSAFVFGRLISDNVLVAFETLHTMASRLSGKEGYMALKLDMSKAYDRLEWDFLEAVLQKLGFEMRWINLLMACVRSVTYSILINGRPIGRIFPSRGLRQGDPLSPYLFIICAEALSSSLRNAERARGITGVPISRGGIRIHHLFFADDSLLFCKANTRELNQLESILDCYEGASGQKINKDKTSIFFSRNTPPVVRDEILSRVGVGQVQSFERYLGLPALVGRSGVSSFNYIKGRIWAKLNGWKEKFLTHAGKEVLLKAVIQAIPTYTMSVFRIPKALTKDINAMMGKFWWSFKDNSRKIAWMAWRRMGRSKDLGGLGYRDIDCFNTALLAKQCWRLLKRPDSLAARVMRGKYFPNSDFLGSNLGKKASFAWRSIWQAKGLLQEGLLWRVGNGRSINLWDDRWIPDPPHKVLDPVRVLLREATVADIINREANWWDVPLIKSIFSEDTVDKICSIPINPRFHEDKLIWRGTKNGGFSVRSAYHLEMERRDRDKGSSSSVYSVSHLWRRLWSLKLPRHILLFLWRACNEILPTKNNLYKRKVVTDQLCPMCGSEAESVSHALWSCG